MKLSERSKWGMLRQQGREENYELYLEKRVAHLEDENDEIKRGIQDAINNIGIPQDGYPAPVAEAYRILDALLTE